MSEDTESAPPAPRANPELTGHEATEKDLVRLFRSGQLPHALLFTGPRGIGKATLAYRFARFVLTQSGEGASGGGLFGDSLPVSDGLDIGAEHPVFHRVAASGHADLFTVERKMDDRGRLRSEIVVEDVRGIGPFLGLTPAEGGWRVVVVDSADDLNRNASNAILKVLEEPPRRSILLMVSHNPGRLLPTIRSRCRQVPLNPLETEQVADLIAKHYPETPPEGATILARLAEGSAGRALALAEEGGAALQRDLDALLETLPILDVGNLHALGDKLARPGAEESFRTLGEILRWRLARLIRAKATANAAEDDPWTQRIASAASLDRWLEVWEKVNHLLARTDSANLDRKQVVLNIFLTLENAVRS